MRTKHRKRRWLRILAAAVILLPILAATAGILYLRPYAEAKMDMTLLNIPTVHEPSTLYAYDEPSARATRSGDLHPAPRTVLSESRPRIYTPYESIPPDLVHAFISIEDKRFRDHRGVDFLRTARAGLHYLLGNATFGGSTITQQLVKNLTGNDRHSLDRKLTEIFQALDLERQTDKDRILEAYLNVINLAEGCYGVGAAAERYFSKSVSELTLPECASIAAITNNPARYDPLTHPEHNRARRDLILRAMAEQNYITDAERDEAMASELNLNPSPPPPPASPTSWYADMVVSDVIRDLQERLGYSYSAASLLVYRGGLTIETAMDETMQRTVESYYARTTHFPVGDKGRPQSSFILIDPNTGDILAVAGAVGEKTANRLQNYATDTRRPAGSCIKPITVYVPALERGIITWADLYEDEPVTVRNGLPWPANADGLYRGPVTIGQAVAWSINPVAVRILEQVGMEQAFTFARDRLGMRGLLPAEGRAANDLTPASLALGQQSRGVTARELTAAYTAFSDGVYRPPVSYHRVLDREGKVLLENPPADERENRVLTPANAAIMTKLLSAVTEEGTAARSVTLSKTLGIQTAGKTGTTQNNCDRWFIGFTPRLLAGVWMGYDYPTGMDGIRGNPCVGIWNDLMQTCESLYRGAPPRSAFPVPDNVIELEFCPLSGKLPNEFCTDPLDGHPTERGWFVKGTEPKDTCAYHTEPPIRIHPEDPADPDRIPLLPNDLIPETETPLPKPPNAQSRDKWYTRWFGFFKH